MIRMGWLGDIQEKGLSREPSRTHWAGRSIVVVSLLAPMLAFIASPAGAQDFPPLADAMWTEFGVDGFEDATPYGINSLGDIVSDYSPPDEDEFGFIRNADGTTVTFSVPESMTTEPRDINTAGTVTGSYRGIVDTSLRGFIRTADGTITIFDGPEATYTDPERIADSGLIAGQYRIGGQRNAFIRFTDGSFTTFIDTRIADINETGDVTGLYLPAAGGSFGMVGTADGAVTTFTVPGATTTRPIAINDAGTIVGNYSAGSLTAGFTRGGFIRTPDGVIETFDVTGSDDTDPEQINSAGFIVGNYDDAEGLRHGFLRTPGGEFVTFDYPGGDSTRLVDINDGGDVLAAGYEELEREPIGRDTGRSFGIITSIYCAAGSSSPTGIQPCAPCLEGTVSVGQGATECVPETVDERTTITNAAASLDDVIAGTTGRDQRILSTAAVLLDRALRDNRWDSGSELNERLAAATYRDIAIAVSQIERIADRTADPALQAELDQITTALLDSARRLAQAKIDAATAAGGSAWLITRANRQVGAGDGNRAQDFLSPATFNYRNAWLLASAAS